MCPFPLRRKLWGALGRPGFRVQGEGSQGWKHGWSQDVSQEPVLEENGEPKLFGMWGPPP